MSDPHIPSDLAPGPAQQRREVLRLAVPAFLALIAEPLFLLADSAIIGHLGTAQLAGLGVASSALVTAAGLFVFLAYGTTASVSRRLGAGDVRGAISNGVDGLWLALGLGVVVGLLVAVLAEPFCAALGAGPDTIGYATTYLRISAAGLPAMFAILAVTGVLRGLQDTRSPLIASVLGFTGNIVLNVLLVYGLQLGIAGAAIGTVIAQTAMALGLCTVVVVLGGRRGARMRPHPAGVLRAATEGVPLLIRTLALRGTLLFTTWVAAGYGTVPLAAYQVSHTYWTFLTFAIDALAIAGQALTGKALGAGDIVGVRAATGLIARWGVYGGCVLGIITIALHRVLPPLFTPDPAVQAALAAGLLVIGLVQPIAGYAFVLDGVLIGAGDARWLAGAQTVLLAAYLPIAFGLAAAGDWLRSYGDPAAVAAVWVGFATFMTLRGAALGWRSRGDAWLVTGLR